MRVGGVHDTQNELIPRLELARGADRPDARPGDHLGDARRDLHGGGRTREPDA
jgi:hypothetical protein